MKGAMEAVARMYVPSLNWLRILNAGNGMDSSGASDGSDGPQIPMINVFLTRYIS